MIDNTDLELEPLDFPHYIDSSMLTTFRACARKHYWSALRQLYPRGQSVHLIAGGAFAAAIEAARKACFASPNPSTVHLDDLLHASYPAFVSYWGSYDPGDKTTKTFENTFNAFTHYLEMFHPGQDELQPLIRPNGEAAIEYKFAIPLDHCPHPTTHEPLIFCGRFDMIGVLPGNIITIVDEKTTSSLTFDWANHWDMRGQFLGYIWALRRQGFKCSHATINGIAILKTKQECRRAIVSYTNDLLCRWEAQLTYTIFSMIKSWQQYTGAARLTRDYCYQLNFGDACESYGGCAFNTLCSVTDPEPFTSNYIRYRFNPVELQPIKELPDGN